MADLALSCLAALTMINGANFGFQNLFLGSVNRYCAVHSHVPVITIPER